MPFVLVLLALCWLIPVPSQARDAAPEAESEKGECGLKACGDLAELKQRQCDAEEQFHHALSELVKKNYTDSSKALRKALELYGDTAGNFSVFEDVASIRCSRTPRGLAVNECSRQYKPDLWAVIVSVAANMGEHHLCEEGSTCAKEAGELIGDLQGQSEEWKRDFADRWPRCNWPPLDNWLDWFNCRRGPVRDEVLTFCSSPQVEGNRYHCYLSICKAALKLETD